MGAGREFDRKQVIERFAQIQSMPAVIKGRILTMGVISIGVLFAGVFVGWYLADDFLIIFSVVLAVFLLLRTGLFLYTVSRNGYETITGQITAIRGQRMPGKMLIVELMVNATEIVELYVNKQHFTKGKTYRFYFMKRKGMVSKAGKIGAMMDFGSYLGQEEIRR